MPAVFGGWVMVVEYLESTMSKELLCKFPDNSAFDFDYSQSSIWSPLIPRHFSSDSSSSPKSFDRRRSCISKLEDGLSRKLMYNDDKGAGLTKIKKVSAKIKRKFADMVFDNLPKCLKVKKKKRRNSLGFSPIPPYNKLQYSTPTPKKGWEKLLKAASKNFKKKNKKKDSIVHKDLCNYA